MVLSDPQLGVWEFSLLTEGVRVGQQLGAEIIPVFQKELLQIFIALRIGSTASEALEFETCNAGIDYIASL